MRFCTLRRHEGAVSHLSSPILSNAAHGIARNRGCFSLAKLPAEILNTRELPVMTSESNEPSGDSPTPPNPTPATESEFWELDEEQPVERPAPLVPQNRAKSITQIQPGTATPTPPPPASAPRQPRVTGKAKPDFVAHNRQPLNSDMGELDTSGWEDSPAASQAEVEPISNEPFSPVPGETPIAPALEPAEGAPAAPAMENAAEITPAPAPAVEPSPGEPTGSFPLGKGEKTVLALLALLLLAAATAFVVISADRLPSDQSLSSKTDFPLKGERVGIQQVTTFWRTPGERDTARRDTKLLPVLVARTDGGPAALRVFFRSAQGEVIGDPVTRSVSSGETEFAATAGFDTDGMLAAYRTGESKPWKIEVYEAPSVDSPRQQFKKLFEIPISSDRH